MIEQPIDMDGSALSEAMALIDPSGILVPGTDEYELIRDMVVKWIDGCGPENAIYMARQGARHLEKWIKCR